MARNLNSRLNAIEKRIEKMGLGGDCSACGRIRGQGLRYIGGSDEPGEGAACGFPMDAMGRALGTAHGDGTVKCYSWDSDPLGVDEGELG